MKIQLPLCGSPTCNACITRSRLYQLSNVDGYQSLPFPAYLCKAIFIYFTRTYLAHINFSSSAKCAELMPGAPLNALAQFFPNRPMFAPCCPRLIELGRYRIIFIVQVRSERWLYYHVQHEFQQGANMWYYKALRDYRVTLYEAT